MTGLSRLIWFEESMTSAVVAANSGKDISEVFPGQPQNAASFTKALTLLINLVKENPSKVEAPEEQEMEL